MYPCDYIKDRYLFAVAHEIGEVMIDTEFMDDNTIPVSKEMVYSFFADQLMTHWEDNCGEK
jgi:hypothetical protein